MQGVQRKSEVMLCQNCKNRNIMLVFKKTTKQNNTDGKEEETVLVPELNYGQEKSQSDSNILENKLSLINVLFGSGVIPYHHRRVV